MSDKPDTTPEATNDDAEVAEVPTDLSTLSDTELAELKAKVDARGAELAGLVASGSLTADDKADIAAVADIRTDIDAELARRETEMAELAARVAMFAVDTAETVETTDDTAEAADETAEMASDTEETEDDDEPVLADARKFRGASPAFLRSRSQAAEAKPQRKPVSDFMVATGHARESEGTRYESPADVAKALHAKRMAFGTIPAGVHRETISVASGTKTFDPSWPVLGVDPQDNLVALRDLQHSLVASGEACTPQNQLYEFFRLAEPIRDVEDALPTALAPRGGIRYIEANCTLGGATAVGIWGPSGLDPANPASEKPVDRVECPEIAEVLVDAVTQIVVFDNLQYRTFPELIENFMEDVAVRFTLTKQRYYLDAINAAATLTTGIGSYGAARSMLYDLTVAAVGYRKRHHMRRGAMLEVFIPDWAIDVVKQDLFADGDNGLDYMNVPDSAVVEALRARGLNPTFYYDDPTALAASNTLFQPQAAGPLNDFPCTASSYLFAPGTWVKLDGGTLDVGVVRDHALNKTNDFAMFMEEWIGIAPLGCETVRIDSDVVASGSRAGYAASLHTCVGS